MRGPVRLLAATVLALATAGTAPTLAHASGEAVAYQLNAAHDGRLEAGVAPPLTALWSRDLGQPASYPVIAGGRVFVVTRKGSDGYGSVLHAFDGPTGDVLWTQTLGEEFPWGGIAYGDGRIYAVNAEGRISAFDPATGTSIWSVQLPDQWAFSSEPTFSEGIVYTSGAGFGGTLYAVDAATGSLLWREPVAGGDGSSPAVDGSRVYTSYACPNVHVFDKLRGELVWEYRPGCSGGGGRTPVLHDGRLYVQDGAPGIVFDAASGARLGEFAAGPPPAFAGGTMVHVEEGRVQTRSAASREPGWSWSSDDGTPIVLPPLVVDDHALVASAAGGLYALRLADGEEVWTGTAGAAIRAHDDLAGLWPRPALGAGDGLLVVPAGTVVSAFRFDGRGEAPSPDAPALVMSARPRDLLFGRRTRISLGGAGAGRPVVLQADTFPYDGAWRRIRSGVTAPGGGYRTRVRPQRNTLLRAVSQDRAGRLIGSNFVRVRVALRRSVAVRRAGGLLRVVISLRGPARLRLPSRTAYLYAAAADGPLRRIGSTRLRRVARGRLAGRLFVRTAAAPRGTRLASCTAGGDDGFSRHTRLERECGRALVPRR